MGCSCSSSADLPQRGGKTQKHNGRVWYGKPEIKKAAWTWLTQKLHCEEVFESALSPLATES